MTQSKPRRPLKPVVPLAWVLIVRNQVLSRDINRLIIAGLEAEEISRIVAVHVLDIGPHSLAPGQAPGHGQVYPRVGPALCAPGVSELLGVLVVPVVVVRLASHHPARFGELALWGGLPSSVRSLG